LHILVTLLQACHATTPRQIVSCLETKLESVLIKDISIPILFVQPYS